MTQSNKSLRNKILLSIAFMGGGAIFASTLLVIKLLAPYYGASNIVLNLVILFTLGGLTLGYFAGGFLSNKSRKDIILLTTVIYGAMTIIVLPFITPIIISLSYEFTYRGSLFLTSFLVSSPIAFALGVAPPIIASIKTDSIEESGKSSGVVFSYTAFGGIIFLMLFSFIIIPYAGLFLSAIIIGLLLGLLPAIYLFKYGFKTPGSFITVFVVAMFFQFWQKNVIGNNFDILYIDEGVQGQIVVADINTYQDEQTRIKQRALFINMELQASTGFVDSLAYDFQFIQHCKSLFSNYSSGSNLLIVGLNGSALVNSAINEGMNTDVLEVDNRLIDISNQYFNLDQRVNLLHEDVRWYLKHSEKKYDLIIFDIFKRDGLLENLITIEALDEFAQKLSNHGTMLIHTHEFFNNIIGKGNRSILKTLFSYGFQADFVTINEAGGRRNGIIYASRQAYNYSDLKVNDHDIPFVSKNEIDIIDAIIFTDNKAILSNLDFFEIKERRVKNLSFIGTLVKSKYFPIYL
jgi:predicted membrane-bound spermidine synthase